MNAIVTHQKLTLSILTHHFAIHFTSHVLVSSSIHLFINFSFFFSMSLVWNSLSLSSSSLIVSLSFWNSPLREKLKSQKTHHHLTHQSTPLEKEKEKESERKKHNHHNLKPTTHYHQNQSQSPRKIMLY